MEKGTSSTLADLEDESAASDWRMEPDHLSEARRATAV